ncbi:hypothetical protein [Marinobacterium lutimaris]|uniref:Uncharacterized protein n=1 Tax=Marinobacterium lutimaris TaxID=568106 RepID=A0A1H6BHJ0_9GAMM|nr:hypothetical protein [Marinobacterium lutimaris]SEG60062.1 hypothetical protein SAMN05444390_102651 [Marinobacterium lutimaris]
MKGIEKFALAAALVGFAGIAQATPANDTAESAKAQNEIHLAQASTARDQAVKTADKSDKESKEILTSGERDYLFTITHPNL